MSTDNIKPVYPAPGWVEVDAYNRAEAEGCASLAIPDLIAFKPVSFERGGYPVRVTVEGELLRYADHNFEPEVKNLFVPGAEFRPAAYRNRFSHDEKELFDRMRDLVVDLTRRRFGRPVRPISNLLVQMAPFRIIDAIAARLGQKPAIFEAGPGMGYFGALLALSGYRYMSYDITQALCLWQNRLHAWIAGEEFGELITNNHPASLQRRVVQIPWWKFVHFRQGSPVRADIVYSNSNLGEMHPFALPQVLFIARQILQDSALGLFMFIHHGSQPQQDESTINNLIDQFGFQRVFAKNFHGFILKGRSLPPALLELEQIETPDFNPSGRGGALQAAEIMAVAPQEAPLDVVACQLLFSWQPPFKQP